MVDLARWETVAQEIVWDAPYEELYRVTDSGRGQWFPGARLNLTTNLVDRHLETRGDHLALSWEGEPGDLRELTYRELHDDVSSFAAALTSLGVTPSDIVAVYTGLLPETIITMLACARVGAAWCVLPAVLPPDALAERLRDLQPRVLVTQDGAWRHGVMLPLKARADDALTAVADIQTTIVIRRVGNDVAWYEGDRWYHDLMATPRHGQTEATPASVSAQSPVLVTHVANRRGRSMGVIHATAQLLAFTQELHRRGLGMTPDEVLWAPAEIGWVSTQTHGILGPLANGATSVVYEGMLDTPNRARIWEMIERHQVNGLLVTPSVIRAVRRRANNVPTTEQIAPLRLVTAAGESLDTTTRVWLQHDVGRDKLLLSDGWGQTELGGVVSLQPPLTEAGAPTPGLLVVDENGRPVADGVEGDLVMLGPWPGHFIGYHGREDATEELVSSPYETGDRALVRPDGTMEFLGRSDRVLNISGQLVAAAEIIEVIEEHPYVARAEIVDKPDARTGSAIVAFVWASADAPGPDELAAQLQQHVRDALGGLAQPRTVVFLDQWPDLNDGQLVRTLRQFGLTATQASLIRAAHVVAASQHLPMP